MSVLSEKVRTALYAKMNVSNVTSLATGGIHHIAAPAGTKMPYVVFQRQASVDVVRAFQQNLIAENDVWLIKAVSDEDCSVSKEPQTLNEDILAAVETAIGTSLSLSGGSVTWNVERIQDVPEFVEMFNDRLVYYNSFLLRVWSH